MPATLLVGAICTGTGGRRNGQQTALGPALPCTHTGLAVPAGYDASYMDPLGHMMLGSEDYRYFMQVMQVRWRQASLQAAPLLIYKVWCARHCCLSAERGWLLHSGLPAIITVLHRYAVNTAIGPSRERDMRDGTGQESGRGHYVKGVGIERRG